MPDLGDDGMAEEVDTIAFMPLSKKGNFKQCQSCRIINLVSHPGKILLRVILSRLKAKAEELLAEEQAGFRPGWSTVKHLQCSSRDRQTPTTLARAVPELHRPQEGV